MHSTVVRWLFSQSGDLSSLHLEPLKWESFDELWVCVFFFTMTRKFFSALLFCSKADSVWAVKTLAANEPHIVSVDGSQTKDGSTA